MGSTRRTIPRHSLTYAGPLARLEIDLTVGGADLARAGDLRPTPHE